MSLVLKVISSAPSIKFSNRRWIPAPTSSANTDESTIELDKPEIDQKILVTYRKTVDSPESTADFVMLMPSEVDKVIKISRGKNLTVPYIPETTFLVLDAGDDGAKIRDNKTKQEYHILKLIDSEWDEVPQPPASK